MAFRNTYGEGPLEDEQASGWAQGRAAGTATPLGVRSVPASARRGPDDGDDSFDQTARGRTRQIMSSAPRTFLPLTTKTPYQKAPEFSCYEDTDSEVLLGTYEVSSEHVGAMVLPADGNPIVDAQSAILDERARYPWPSPLPASPSDTMKDGSFYGTPQGRSTRSFYRLVTERGSRRTLRVDETTKMEEFQSFSSVNSIPAKYRLIPEYVDIAHKEDDKMFWIVLQIFYMYGLWPDIDTLPDTFQDLCAKYDITDNDLIEMPPLSPTWLRYLFQVNDPIFKDIIRKIFETRKEPLWDVDLDPEYTEKFESLGLGQWDFTNQGYADLI